MLLDLQGEDFPTIANEIVDTLISSGQLPHKQREPVLRILLKKHKHSNDITLWEKLKQSAVDPCMCVCVCVCVNHCLVLFVEGRLHHIGEGLRRISHAHGLSELATEGDSSRHNKSRRKSLPDITLREAKGSKEKSLGTPESYREMEEKSFKRISSAPLIGDSDAVSVVSVCVCGDSDG